MSLDSPPFYMHTGSCGGPVVVDKQCSQDERERGESQEKPVCVFGKL